MSGGRQELAHAPAGYRRPFGVQVGGAGRTLQSLLHISSTWVELVEPKCACFRVADREWNGWLVPVFSQCSS